MMMIMMRVQEQQQQQRQIPQRSKHQKTLTNMTATTATRFPCNARPSGRQQRRPCFLGMMHGLLLLLLVFLSTGGVAAQEEPNGPPPDDATTMPEANTCLATAGGTCRVVENGDNTDNPANPTTAICQGPSDTWQAVSSCQTVSCLGPAACLRDTITNTQHVQCRVANDMMSHDDTATKANNNTSPQPYLGPCAQATISNVPAGGHIDCRGASACAGAQITSAHAYTLTCRGEEELNDNDKGNDNDNGNENDNANDNGNDNGDPPTPWGVACGTTANAEDEANFFVPVISNHGGNMYCHASHGNGQQSQQQQSQQSPEQQSPQQTQSQPQQSQQFGQCHNVRLADTIGCLICGSNTACVNVRLVGDKPNVVEGEANANAGNTGNSGNTGNTGSTQLTSSTSSSTMITTLAVPNGTVWIHPQCTETDLLHYLNLLHPAGPTEPDCQDDNDNGICDVIEVYCANVVGDITETCLLKYAQGWNAVMRSDGSYADGPAATSDHNDGRDVILTRQGWIASAVGFALGAVLMAVMLICCCTASDVEEDDEDGGDQDDSDPEQPKSSPLDHHDADDIPANQDHDVSLLLEKWKSLDADDQAKLFADMDELQEHSSALKEMDEKLLQIRRQQSHTTVRTHASSIPEQAP